MGEEEGVQRLAFGGELVRGNVGRRVGIRGRVRVRVRLGSENDRRGAGSEI
jgi:hypothetical protein